MFNGLKSITTLLFISFQVWIDIFKNHIFDDDSEQGILSQKFIFHPDCFPDLSFLESIDFSDSRIESNNRFPNLCEIKYIKVDYSLNFLIKSTLKGFNQEKELESISSFSESKRRQKIQLCKPTDFYELRENYDLFEFSPCDQLFPQKQIEFLDHYPSYLFLAFPKSSDTNNKPKIDYILSPVKISESFLLLTSSNNFPRDKLEQKYEINDSIGYYLPKKEKNEKNEKFYNLIFPFSTIYGHSIPLPLVPISISTKTVGGEITNETFGNQNDWEAKIRDLARDHGAIPFNQNVKLNVSKGRDNECWLNIELK